MFAIAGAILTMALAVPHPAYAASAPSVSRTTSTSVKALAASTSCTAPIGAIGNGVRIRTAPNTSATVVGLAYYGQKFTADCNYNNVGGSYGKACGGPDHSNLWERLKFQGVWRYSVWWCFV
jgi:hypothetical protein